MKADFMSIAIELILLVGVRIFSRGFFPPTRTKLGFSTETPDVPRQFDRMVFMLVDAMRSDFMFSDTSAMPGVHQLLMDGKGYAFTAFSDPPTVTLPRLKGITTGSPPNFLDAVINVAESESASCLQNLDSWVHQIQSQNRSIHLRGDNTWLKLFPGMFAEEDGTSSFYVADYTEVDQNVTRHLDSDLSSDGQWDVLILHYLGLDHIGHKGGPDSLLMGGKQREMDSIATKIFDSLDDRTLFVMLGDHGMNERGNHGGASSGETSAALAMFSKKFNNPLIAPLPVNDDYSYYSRIFQVDIVPTLAMLLGFPIPKNSLGVFVEQLLPLWPDQTDHEKIKKLNCDQLGLSPSECTFDTMKNTQIHLMRTSTEHILSYMYEGIALLALAMGYVLFVSYKLLKQNVTSQKTPKLLFVWWLVLPIFYFISMMGSSTVEEEQYVWYWGLTGLLCHAFFAYDSKMSVAVLLACFRVIRGWNSTGQKWSSSVDVGKFLSSHTSLNLYLVGITIALLPVVTRPSGSKLISKSAIPRLSAAVAVLLFKLCATIYQLNHPGMLFLSRVAFGLALLDALFGGGEGSLSETGILLIFIMQCKLQNIPLWIFMVLARKALARIWTRSGDAVTCTLIAVCLEHACFFAFGGSNSLATIDLSNAYNGVSTYNIPFVALLAYLGNWAPSLYWSMMLNISPKLRTLRSLVYCTSCLGVTLACLILREHLFIWTVFSPKLLYVFVWLGLHEILMTTLASLFTKW